MPYVFIQMLYIFEQTQVEMHVTVLVLLAAVGSWICTPANATVKNI